MQDPLAEFTRLFQPDDRRRSRLPYALDLQAQLNGLVRRELARLQGAARPPKRPHPRQRREPKLRPPATLRWRRAILAGRTRMTSRQYAHLDAFIQQKHTSSSELSVHDGAQEELYHVGHFGPEHGFSPAEAWLAERLLQRANQRRPICEGGKRGHFRRCLRIAGIVSAVKHGRVGNTKWGRSMLAHRGGKVMKLHGPHILAQNREQIQQRRQAQQQAQAAAVMLAHLTPVQRAAWQRTQRARQPRRPPKSALEL